MKKMVVVVLILLLCFGVTAAAESSNISDENGSQSLDVMVNYSKNSTEPPIYSVDISWDDLVFSFSESESNIWNPEDHSYTKRSAGRWDRTSASITITNHSNVDVNVTLTYAPIENTGVTGTLSNGTGTLVGGTTGEYDSAASMISTLTISGTPAGLSADSKTKVGTITITIK